MRGIAHNQFVEGGLDVVGSVFGDPELGQEVAQAIDVVTSVAGAIGDVLGFGDEGYTPEQIARNRALHAANMDVAAKAEVRRSSGDVLPRGTLEP